MKWTPTKNVDGSVSYSAHNGRNAFKIGPTLGKNALRVGGDCIGTFRNVFRGIRYANRIAA